MNDRIPGSAYEGGPVAAEGAARTPRPRPPRTRRITAWVLVILAAVLIPISVLSVWAITTVTNTDQYVATMAPLARNPVIIEHLASKATNELFSTHIVQREVAGALPPKAKPIVQPIMNQLKSFVHGLALKVFESEQFGRLFDSLNRQTQTAAVDVLEGKQTSLTKRLGKGGQVVLDLTPALNQLIDKVDSHGVTLFDPLKPILDKSNGLGLTIVQESQVSKFSRLFNTLVTLGWAVPLTAVVLALLGVLVAVERRKALLRLAAGVGLFALVLLGLLAYARTTFLQQAEAHRFDVLVAAAVWDTLVRFLEADLRWTLLAAVLVALGAWLAGPAGYAVWVRKKAMAGGRWLLAQTRVVASVEGGVAVSPGVRRTGAWIAEHVKGLRVLGVAIAGLELVLDDNASGWDLVILVVALVAYLGLLQVLVFWGRRVAGSRAQPGSGDARPRTR